MDDVPPGFWKDALGSVAWVVVPIAVVVALFAWAQTRNPWIIVGLLLAGLSPFVVFAWLESRWAGVLVGAPLLTLFVVSVAIDGPYVFLNVVVIVSMVYLFGLLLLAMLGGSSDADHGLLRTSAPGRAPGRRRRWRR